MLFDPIVIVRIKRIKKLFLILTCLTEDAAASTCTSNCTVVMAVQISQQRAARRLQIYFTNLFYNLFFGVDVFK